MVGLFLFAAGAGAAGVEWVVLVQVGYDVSHFFVGRDALVNNCLHHIFRDLFKTRIFLIVVRGLGWGRLQALGFVEERCALLVLGQVVGRFLDSQLLVEFMRYQFAVGGHLVLDWVVSGLVFARCDERVAHLNFEFSGPWGRLSQVR